MKTALAEKYQKEGFLKLSSFFPPEDIRNLSTIIQKKVKELAIDKKNIRFRFKNHLQTGKLHLDAIDPVLDLISEVETVAYSKKLFDLLEEVLEEPIHLFKDKLILKPCGISGYPLHQDYIAWPTFPKSFTTVVVPLEASTIENGCIEIFPGAHQLGNLSPADGDFHDIPEFRLIERPSIFLEMVPGDLAIFGSLMPHRSAPNQSAFLRPQLYLSYNRSSELSDYRKKHYQEAQTWLLNRYQEFGACDYYFK